MVKLNFFTRDIMKGSKFFLFIFAILSGFLFVQCGFFFKDSAAVEINLGGGPVPPAGAGSFKPGIISGGTLSVSSSDSGLLVKDFGAADDTIRMIVPSGRQRVIELEVNLESDIVINPGPVLSYIGTAIVDLAPNETKRVSLRMIPGKTRLLVPDMLAGKVVQMNNITDDPGTYVILDQNTLNTASGGDWPLPVNSKVFNPYDIDMDARGSIYIANNQGVDAAFNRIVRIKKIDGSGFSQFPKTGGFGGPVESLAIDKINNFIYFYAKEAKNPGYLSRINLTTADSGFPYVVEQINLNNESLYTGDTITFIRGMDTDRDGNLYIACVSRNASRIVKIDFNRPQGSRILGSYTDALILNTPFDVIVKGNNLYISNSGDTLGNKLLMIRTADMAFLRSGAIPGLKGEGNISLPTRFFAITEKKIFLIDDNLAAVNALEEFFDLDWTGWKMYTPLGVTGGAYFQFFS
jgi:hypothetical protein